MQASRPVPHDHARDFFVWGAGTAAGLVFLLCLGLGLTNPSRAEFADYYTEEAWAHYPQANNAPNAAGFKSTGKLFLAVQVRTLNFGVATVFFPSERPGSGVILGIGHCFIPLRQPDYPPVSR